MTKKSNTTETVEENVEVAPLENEATEEQTKAEAKKAEAAAKRKELADAKATVYSFTLTDGFKALADEVKEAIQRLAKKAPTTSALASTQGFMEDLFPEVGTAVDEFELFKSTKMGRAEMRKKVFYAMNKCEPDQKRWIRFDEPSESWVLDQIGGGVPENWTPADLPKNFAA